MKPRIIAHKILCQVIQNHRSLTEVFSELIPENNHDRNRGFIKDCSFGVLRWYYSLCGIKSQLLHKPLKKKDADIDCLILLGLYQMRYTRIPQHAIVSETVSICKDIEKPWATGLVNQCLRRFIREKAVLMRGLKNDEVLFSHPEWLIEKIKTAWPNHWKGILEANNEKPPLWLRVNCRKTSREHYQQLLGQHHIETETCPNLPTTLRLKTPVSVGDIPRFFEGDVSVQDLAGQYAAFLLDLKKGQRVLDACAAPGSKASHILEFQSDVDQLVVMDQDDKRLGMAKENISRLQLSDCNVKFIWANALETERWWDGVRYDRILLDAPCSSTGVIRRHPDIKLLRKQEDIIKFSQQQMKLLTTLWKTLKPGGKLLYSTCSILPEENASIISEFFHSHQDASYENLEITFGVKQVYGTQIFPKKNGPDGFYYAKLIKNTG